MKHKYNYVKTIQNLFNLKKGLKKIEYSTTTSGQSLSSSTEQDGCFHEFWTETQLSYFKPAIIRLIHMHLLLS